MKTDKKIKQITERHMHTDKKLTKLKENLKFWTAFIMYQTNNSKLPPSQKDTLTPKEPTTVIPADRRAPLFDGGKYTKIGGMWTLKHDISSEKFYDLLIKKELKGDTALYLNNFYNHINICLNAVTRLREDLLPGYHSIRRHSEFVE